MPSPGPGSADYFACFGTKDLPEAVHFVDIPTSILSVSLAQSSPDHELKHSTDAEYLRDQSSDKSRCLPTLD